MVRTKRKEKRVREEKVKVVLKEFDDEDDFLKDRDDREFDYVGRGELRTTPDAVWSSTSATRSCRGW